MGLFDGIKKEMQLSQEKAAKEKENKKKYDNYQIELKSKFVASGRVGINKFNDELKIIKVSTESYFKDVYVEYKNITEVKIDEKINEKTQTKNVGKRKGVITRSVVGTILMPGVGTVVGGLTAKKENKIQSITTQDIKRKIVLIQNTPYQSLLKITYNEELFSKLKSIINNNTETVEETIYKEERTDNGLSDLIALKELFDQGIITQEDFDAKKKQILGL
ncbi:SHOCT domain-containing protein [Leuconostoc citreum]|uniref:SHOCT domain-containing protein n=1 Tax=Leuconostoc citreum TaxID=33964 RepID=UPI00200ADA8C|nr:SHOCT domain-containing protein [Leuconostoc citreum]MCK8605180.1 SHOCT domain-containing protein [Leuconostoc citreum]